MNILVGTILAAYSWAPRVNASHIWYASVQSTLIATHRSKRSTFGHVYTSYPLTTVKGFTLRQRPWWRESVCLSLGMLERKRSLESDLGWARLGFKHLGCVGLKTQTTMSLLPTLSHLQATRPLPPYLPACQFTFHLAWCPVPSTKAFKHWVTGIS